MSKCLHNGMHAVDCPEGENAALRKLINENASLRQRLESIRKILITLKNPTSSKRFLINSALLETEGVPESKGGGDESVTK